MSEGEGEGERVEGDCAVMQTGQGTLPHTLEETTCWVGAEQMSNVDHQDLLYHQPLGSDVTGSVCVCQPLKERTRWG
jgi:hypothetical protein